LGPAPNHAKDVYLMLNLQTRKIITSRDIQWMNMVYGDWKNLKEPSHIESEDLIVPNERKASLRNHQVKGELQAEPVTKELKANPKEELTEPNPRVPKKQPFQSPLKPTPPPTKLVSAMKNLNTFYNTDAKSFVERNQALQDGSSAGRVETTEDDVAKDEATKHVEFDLDEDKAPEQELGFNEHIATMAMMNLPCEVGLLETTDSEDLDPSQYKDVFDVPDTFEEAWHHPDPFQRDKWKEAIEKELAKMEERGVWKAFKIRDIPKNKRLIQNKWVLEIKRSGIFRARNVAKGFSQVGGTDFDQIYSPMVHDITFRLMLIMKILFQLHSFTFDVETAFLLGDLEGIELYMRLPKGMVGDPRVDCVQLLKTIYGLTQSSWAFFKLWANTMEELEFTQSPADPCLFTRGTGESMLILCIYVDDGYILGKRPEILKFFAQLRATSMKITTEESTNDYLSCEVKVNKAGNRAWLGQPHLVKKLEKTFGEEVSHMETYKTPGTPGQGITRPKEGDMMLPAERQARFQSGTGMLLYLIKHSRPDIANAFRELTKVMDKAVEKDMQEMFRIIKHVLDTKHWGLKICPKTTTMMNFAH